MRRLRGRRSLMGVALAGAAAVGMSALSACEPADGQTDSGGQMNFAAVAVTTDQMGTRELERQHVDVRWLNCTATYGKAKVVDNNGEKNVGAASVDCRGEAEDGRDITLTGKVTSEVEDRCVRGDLTARVEGKEWFRVSVLGDCEGGPPQTEEPNPEPDPKPDPKPDPEPDPTWHQPDPTVTVTVTVQPGK
ncbi:hypothetical protein ACQB60_04655 [Actinomycetota bacterium Odt1-20B]